MKYKGLFIVVIFACMTTSLIVFSGAGSDGALNGLKLCYSVIIPSLFPFTVFSLIIFDSGFFDSVKLQKVKFNFEELSISLLSCIGGFPVGAKLINNAYLKGNISKKNSELMLGYCVSSGPSFIILAVGCGILDDKKLGYVLFTSNILANIIIAIILSFFKKPTKNKLKIQKLSTPFSEVFVNATYDATQSILGICAYVVLFSTIISVFNNIFIKSNIKNALLSLLEITNGISLSGNLYFIAFLLGFGGICVHFQVLTMCKDLKPRYSLFLLLRILHGTLLSLITKFIVMVFNINVSTLSPGSQLTYKFSENSIAFGIALVALSVAFILSVNKQNNIV